MMRKFLSVGAFGVVACVFSMSAIAGHQSGTVTHVLKRASDGLLYFRLSGTPQARPPCAVSTFYWIIKDENSATGRQQLALLLTARATGAVVSVSGAGACTRWGDEEDVNVIEY